MAAPEGNPAHWFACDQIERQPDSYVLWHTHACDVCSFKAGVQLKTLTEAGPWPGGEQVYELYTRYLGRFAKVL